MLNLFSFTQNPLIKKQNLNTSSFFWISLHFYSKIFLTDFRLVLWKWLSIIFFLKTASPFFMAFDNNCIYVPRYICTMCNGNICCLSLIVWSSCLDDELSFLWNVSVWTQQMICCYCYYFNKESRGDIFYNLLESKWLFH